jgi:hypothetical protein
MTSRHTLPDLRILSTIASNLSFAAKYTQFIDVWMEDAIHKSNTRALIWILIWQLDVDLPQTANKRSWGAVSLGLANAIPALTLFWTFESHVKFLPSRGQQVGYARGMARPTLPDC